MCKLKENKEKITCFFESFIMIYKFTHYIYEYKEKMAFWTSESFLMGISTFQSHSRRTTFMAFQAQLCTTLPSVECGKKITTWNRRNMGTSAVKDFCSSVPVWHRFVLLKPLLINMMPWINEGLDNPLAQKFPIFSKVLLKPSMLCCSDFTICEKSKHLPFFSCLVFFDLCSWK